MWTKIVSPASLVPMYWRPMTSLTLKRTTSIMVMMISWTGLAVPMMTPKLIRTQAQAKGKLSYNVPSFHAGIVTKVRSNQTDYVDVNEGTVGVAIFVVDKLKGNCYSVISNTTAPTSSEAARFSTVPSGSQLS